MKTSAELSAGVRDCAVSTQTVASAQSQTPGYPPNRTVPSNSFGPRKKEVTESDCSSLLAEGQVLGGILLAAPRAFELIKEHGIGRTHFYDLRFRELFILLERMHEANETIDLATVFHRAKERGLSIMPDGPSFLAGLPDAIPSVESLPIFLEELKELHPRRTLVDFSRRLQQIAVDRSAPAHLLLEDAENVLKQIRKISSPRQSQLSVSSAAELVQSECVENDNILADRLLAKGQSLTLLGAGGLGKSRLLLQLAACVITGQPFLGLRTHAPGLKWLIFQAENSRMRLKHDLERLKHWLGDDWSKVAERLFIHTIQTGNDAFLQLDAPGVSHRLSDAIEEHDPDVVCFDPLNCFGVGDLNRDSDMRTSCQALTQLCATGRTDRGIVVLHHALTGRVGAAKATGIERSSFGRNSKLLQAWTRGQINLAPASRNDNQRLVLSCGKCSNGEEFEPYAIKLNPATMIYEVEPEFNHDAWMRELIDGKRHDDVDDLLEICAQPIARADAVRKLIETAGHSRTTAYRTIKNALDNGMVEEKNGVLVNAQT